MEDKINDKKTLSFVIRLSISIIIAFVLVAGGTFAYWQWASIESKNVVFNTVSGFEEYVVYDAGDSHFVGDFQETDSFCESVSTTVSAYKTRNDIEFTMTINMDINEIGASIASSDNIYWVVTKGNKDISCSTGVNGLNAASVVSYGTFNGKTAPSTFSLTESMRITSSKAEYTVWIWISNDSELVTGETIDTHVWSQIDMLDKEAVDGTEDDNPGKENAVGEAYAVYSADDNSLRFYRSETPITVGSQYRGRTVTVVYTNFEDSDVSPSWTSNSKIVVFEDYIYPVSTYRWFHWYEFLEMDLRKLDTSNVTDMSSMFILTTIENPLDVSYFDTSNVTNMDYMFENLSAPELIGLENWDVSSLETMDFMFVGVNTSVTGLKGMETWDTSNVTDMSGMFANSTITGDGTLDLSGWNVCNVEEYDGFDADIVSGTIISPFFGDTSKCNGGLPA